MSLRLEIMGHELKAWAYRLISEYGYINASCSVKAPSYVFISCNGLHPGYGLVNVLGSCLMLMRSYVLGIWMLDLIASLCLIRVYLHPCWVKAPSVVSSSIPSYTPALSISLSTYLPTQTTCLACLSNLPIHLSQPSDSRSWGYPSGRLPFGPFITAY